MKTIGIIGSSESYAIPILVNWEFCKEEEIPGYSA